MRELDLKEAAEAVRRGGLLVYPTETYYAVGCSALDAAAIHRVFGAKRRGHGLPLPVIIGSLDQLSLVAGPLSPQAEELIRELAEKFWPGPLSILVPAGEAVPPELCAGTGRVAVRLSSHAEAAGLCLTAGCPLVSSSANISGRPPVVEPADLDPELTTAVDGGLYDPLPRPSGGLPSTIVEIYQEPSRSDRIGLRVLRAGAVSVADLRDQGFLVCEI
ncbi:MAG: L-threonylcarbamoyladenylate synthase [Deltaproteobacteria bacterium]|nr:L-threonylcarbamoyladenylate synthase [Deltaproteobacteria bacterium]